MEWRWGVILCCVCWQNAHDVCVCPSICHLCGAAPQGLLLCNMEMGYLSSVLMHVSGLTEKQ